MASNYGDGGGWRKQARRRDRKEPLIDDVGLAAELNALTVNEREQINELIHGVANDRIEETPEFVSSKLEELKEELATVPRPRRKEYTRALFLKPSLKDDIKFHLMFLRADQFDARKAANRVCSYFTNKRQIFGSDKLVKRITLEDLDEDDMDCLRACHFMVLDQKDQSGRRVWFACFQRLRFKHWKNNARVMWYRITSDLYMDETSQVEGTAAVFYALEVDFKTASKMYEAFRSTSHMVVALPNRFVSFHFCYDSNLIRQALSLYQMIVGKKNRLHSRFHYAGSPTEVVDIMMSFGIHLDRRIESDNKEPYFSEAFEKFVADRRQIEEGWKQEELELLKAGKKAYPSQNDVIIGRGRPYMEHPGNATLAKYIDEGFSKYHLMEKKSDKTDFSLGMLKKVHETGGHFLVRKADCWEIAPTSLARGKISRALRLKVQTMKEASSGGDKAKESAPLAGDDSSSLHEYFTTKKGKFDVSAPENETTLWPWATTS